MISEIIKLIENGCGEEAVALLKQIRENNRGHEKLGDPHAVVITYPTHVSEEVIDSVRPYVQARFGGNPDASNLRTMALLIDSPAMRVIPEWFKKYAGHVGTDDFSQLLFQTLVEIDLQGEDVGNIPFPYTFEESKLREELLFAGTIKQIDAPLPATN